MNLDPCPFCGSPVTGRPNSGLGSFLVQVTCSRRACVLGSGIRFACRNSRRTIGAFKEHVASFERLWNTRANLPPTLPAAPLVTIPPAPVAPPIQPAPVAPVAV